MHPSIALQAAEREIEEEEGRVPREFPTLPPPFLHFAPRWHQKRRTMTGVLAGYFDQPPRNAPLPILPGAHALLTRTAAPAVSEEDLVLLEKERRRLEALELKRACPGGGKPKRLDFDSVDDVVVGDVKRIHDRSSIRSDSPSTDTRLPSVDSTPPLTPATTPSILSGQDDVRVHVEKKQTGLSKGGRPSNTKPSTNKSSTVAATSAKDASDNRRGRKRKHSETEKPMQRPREVRDTSEGARQRRKSRPGWKGWVEVEGSPEPKPNLINLDVPVETLENRTRSGRVPSNLPPVAPRRSKASTKNSVRTDSETLAPSSTATPAPADSAPLGDLTSNPPRVADTAEV